jgi:hypothetical protein
MNHLWSFIVGLFRRTPQPRLRFLNGSEYTERCKRDRKTGRWYSVLTRVK